MATLSSKNQTSRDSCEHEITCVRDLRLGKSSRRTAEVGLHFGLPLFGGSEVIVEPTEISFVPGQIVLILGPSGSGKSSMLAAIDKKNLARCHVDRVSFPTDAALIDRIAPWASLSEAISILTTCGLSEPRLWIRRFTELSDGEKFRARLSRAVALQARGNTKGVLLCDEFCALLHRRLAKSISFGLRKLVTRKGLCLVVACTNEDIVKDLAPDVVVKLPGSAQSVVEHRSVKYPKSVSFARRLRIEPGRKRDYAAFAAMHYRKTDELGFVDRVFVLREGAGSEPLGIVVYAHSPLQLAMRNKALAGKFGRDASVVNRFIRILRRLVIHPDLRGCGLGYWLVKKTLPDVGTRYVECLAAMGEFNPVFERAGMVRIGQYEMSPDRQRALAQLRELQADPYSRDFPLQVSRRRLVREIVARVVRRWYAATTGGGQSRVERQTPETLAQTFRGLIGCRPVYYLWDRRHVA